MTDEAPEASVAKKGGKGGKATATEAETAGAAADGEQQNEEAAQQQPEEVAQHKQPRRVLTAQDASLPDAELGSLQLCELATCPESIALGMAVRLATVSCRGLLQCGIRTTLAAYGLPLGNSRRLPRCPAPSVFRASLQRFELVPY